MNQDEILFFTTGIEIRIRFLGASLPWATWLDALHRHNQRIAQMKPRVFALQFGGAVGTLAPLGLHGRKVAERIAKRLKVEMPAVPWHTQRDRMAEMGCVLAMLVGTLGKMGRDVSLLMQSEVGEFFEPDGEGRGGSSTMPHKRNPISSAILLSAATRVPGLVAALLSAAVQEHERGLGGWHAEWETMTEVFRLAGGAMHHALGIAEGGSVDAAAMQRNLDLLGGVPMAETVSYAVAAKLGKMRAHGILEKASRRAVSRPPLALIALMVSSTTFHRCTRSPALPTPPSLDCEEGGW